MMILTLTGCGKGGDQVVCTMKADESGMSITQKMTLSFKNDNVNSVDMEIDVKLADEYKSLKDLLVSSMKSQFESWDSEYGIKLNFKDTSDGLKISGSFNSESFAKLNASGEKTSKSDAVKSLEEQGYTCK